MMCLLGSCMFPAHKFCCKLEFCCELEPPCPICVVTWLDLHVEKSGTSSGTPRELSSFTPEVKTPWLGQCHVALMTTTLYRRICSKGQLTARETEVLG